MGLAVAVSGCVSTAGRKLDPAEIRTIKPGVTTKAQVRAMFGAPMQLQVQPNGTEMWQYIYGAGSYLPGSSNGQSVAVVFKGNVVSMCQAGTVEQVGGAFHTVSVPCDRM